MKRLLIGLGSVLLLVGSIFLVLNRYEWTTLSERRYPDMQTVVERTYRNYGKDIVRLAREKKLPPEYFLSVIALESSGRKLVPHRFEPHVFRSLIKLQNGELEKYDHVVAAQLQGMKKGQVKKLASSWGPMQLMGYQSFMLGTHVKHLNGSRALPLGVEWVDKSYGHHLREGRFKDAFHIHNTGKKYPLFGPPSTFHRSYVPMGIAYLNAFKTLLNESGS
jgi:hypothetical protein